MTYGSTVLQCAKAPKCGAGTVTVLTLARGAFWALPGLWCISVRYGNISSHSPSGNLYDAAGAFNDEPRAAVRTPNRNIVAAVAVVVTDHRNIPVDAPVRDHETVIAAQFLEPLAG